jgi:hypothetical protein
MAKENKTIHNKLKKKTQLVINLRKKVEDFYNDNYKQLKKKIENIRRWK